MSIRPLLWVLLLLVALPDAHAGEPETSGQGKLRLVTNYWADVYVDGKRRGRAPMPSLSLPAGRHVVELRGNPVFKDYRIEVVIKATLDRWFDRSLNATTLSEVLDGLAQ